VTWKRSTSVPMSTAPKANATLKSASASGPAKEGRPMARAKDGMYRVGRKKPRDWRILPVWKSQNWVCFTKDMSMGRKLLAVVMGRRGLMKEMHGPDAEGCAVAVEV
jgi:hypothetical protein